MAQGEIWWADLGEPRGAGPGYRRPVVIIQGDPLNRSGVATIICVILTSNLKWADAPGNVLIPARISGLEKDSVANVSQMMTVDRSFLTEKVGRISHRILELILGGLDVVLDRWARS